MSKRKATPPLTPAPEAAPLLADLRRLIEEARRSAAVAVNARLTLMYWRIGKRIRSEELGDERAVYGETIELSRHCRDNWRANTGVDSPRKICAA